MLPSAAVETDLRIVITAVADLTDGQLTVLIETVNGVPKVAPGLLAWLKGTADREQNRRRFRIPPQQGVLQIGSSPSFHVTAELADRRSAAMLPGANHQR
jgi:hypothetical protein